MATGKQATFGEIRIDVADPTEDCKKVETVKDGKRITCSNSAKYRIIKPNGKDDFRCGMHISDYSALVNQ